MIKLALAILLLIATQQSFAEDGSRLYSGTYRIDGNQWFLTVDAAWNPAWDGTVQVRDFGMLGDRLTVRSPWQHAVNFPGTSLSRGTVVFERVE